MLKHLSMSKNINNNNQQKQQQQNKITFLEVRT
jgi:hypothetical protein